MNPWLIIGAAVIVWCLFMLILRLVMGRTPSAPRTTLRDDLKDIEQRYKALNLEDKKLLDGVVERTLEIHAPNLKYIMEGKKLQPKPEPKPEKSKDGPPDLWT